eukprot:TRINITY_DN2046_c0_g1_i3.p1 TRINITY_DN2046_c0_g1~~TRINITY_DN2046_c0_g1_i3.p1  ORF type:complete len:933 (+),score=195.00 TRINITY_DN2046_c0_g1_i3:328-3126(+)
MRLRLRAAAKMQPRPLALVLLLLCAVGAAFAASSSPRADAVSGSTSSSRATLRPGQHSGVLASDFEAASSGADEERALFRREVGSSGSSSREVAAADAASVPSSGARGAAENEDEGPQSASEAVLSAASGVANVAAGLAAVPAAAMGAAARDIRHAIWPAALLNLSDDDIAFFSSDKSGLENDGAVMLARPLRSSSAVVRAEEKIEACVFQGTPMQDCWKKYGSYGLRRLRAEDFRDIFYNGWLPAVLRGGPPRGVRPNWMKHGEVRAKNFLEVTFPGTHHSGCYVTRESEADPEYGVTTQNLDVVQQLFLGIRAFHIRVAMDPKGTALYTSHRRLCRPLRQVLQDINGFLTTHPSEVVILDVAVDDEIVAFSGETKYTQALLDEENDVMRIPGQTVHEVVREIFGDKLALYSRLDRLPAEEVLENPKIGSSVDVGVQVYYFWKTQQVLCSHLAMCQDTPGWKLNPSGWSLPFGPPLPMGERQNVSTAARKTERVVEPACIFFHQANVTDEQNASASAFGPERVVLASKEFWSYMPKAFEKSAPSCFPKSKFPPRKGAPTALYVSAPVYNATFQEMLEQGDILGKTSHVYTRGEGFSVRSEAERLNYLLLTWLFGPDSQELYRRPNVVFLDFPAPVLVHRIIEAIQMRIECGYAIYCKESGSCWARSLLPPGAASGTYLSESYSSCFSEAEVAGLLEERAAKSWLRDWSWMGFLRSTFRLLVFGWLASLAIYWRRRFFGSFYNFDDPTPTRTKYPTWAAIMLDLRDPERSSQQACSVTKLRITGGDVDGLYEVVKDRTVNGMPLWKRSEGDMFVFSGPSGKWFIGGKTEEDAGFASDSGLASGPKPHNGADPSSAYEAGSWLSFNADRQEWEPAPNLLVAKEAEAAAPATNESAPAAAASSDASAPATNESAPAAAASSDASAPAEGAAAMS